MPLDPDGVALKLDFAFALATGTKSVMLDAAPSRMERHRQCRRLVFFLCGVGGDSAVEISTRPHLDGVA